MDFVPNLIVSFFVVYLATQFLKGAWRGFASAVPFLCFSFFTLQSGAGMGGGFRGDFWTDLFSTVLFYIAIPFLIWGMIDLFLMIKRRLAQRNKNQ